MSTERMDQLSDAGIWPLASIGSVCKEIFSGGTPLTTRPEYYVGGDVPWLKTKEVNQRRIYSTENHITQLGLLNSSAKLVPVNSVTVAMYGDGQTAGRVGLTEIPLSTNQACCNLVIDQEKADAEFVFYQLVDSYDELVSRKTGSGQQNLNGRLIREFEISLPPLPEQRAVADVLSSLDAKIDLLHRQNETLDTMVATLFRQWFEETAEDHWAEYSVGDFADHLKQGVQPGDQPSTDFLHFSLPAFDAGQRAVVEPGAQILSNKFRVSEGVLLVSKLNPRVSRVWPIDKLPEGTQAICSTEFQVLKPKKRAWFGYLYGLLTSSEARDALTMAASGTSGSHQRVRPEDILAIKTSLPNVDLAEQFSFWVEPVMSKRQHNIEQMTALERTRDTLLPKLMSGEVRVAV